MAGMAAVAVTVVTVAAMAVDSGSQKVQRESEKLYFHTSITYEWSEFRSKTHRIWNRRPAPDLLPMSF